MNENSIELFNLFHTNEAPNFGLGSTWRKDFAEKKNDEKIPLEDEDARDIRNLFDGINTEVENENDVDTSSDDSEAENSYQRDVTVISDEEIQNLRVKELNKLLRNIPLEEAAKIRKRRRNLKNRGYALNCRMKKQRVYEDLTNENTLLKKQLEDERCKLLKIFIEKEEYKKKYLQTERAFAAYKKKQETSTLILDLENVSSLPSKLQASQNTCWSQLNLN